MVPEDIAVVVHTCPARDGKLETLKQSISESDIDDESVEWAREPDGATNYEKRLHYLTLLCRNARRAPYVLRLEDDIVVNKHILHNLCRWLPVQRRDFGCGLVFVDNRLHLVPEVKNQATDDRGELYRTRPKTMWAQAHLYASKPLQKASEMYWEMLRCKGFDGRTVDKYALAFDWAITGALGELGYRIYLHVPSLATCSDVADMRAGGRRVNIRHEASDFDPDWKRS